MPKHYKHYKCGQWSWISKYFDAYFNGCLPIRKDRTEEYPLGWDLDHLLWPLNLTSKQKWNILVSRSLRPVLSQDHNTLSDVARNTVHFGVCSIRKAGASPLSPCFKIDSWASADNGSWLMVWQPGHCSQYIPNFSNTTKDNILDQKSLPS